MSDTPLTPAEVQAAEERASKEGYIHHVLVSFDDFWNVVTGGQIDETISARVGRVAKDPVRKHKLLAVVLNHALDWIQPNHGEKAAAGDMERAEAVEKTEGETLGSA